MARPEHEVAQWSTGLFDCFTDMENCCITCWCPCITFGMNTEIIDRGSSSCPVNGALWLLIEFFTGAACIYSCIYRKRLREQYSLQGSIFEDGLVHILCEPCALCQEYRELKNQGYDVLLGWNANLERQAREGPMVPAPVEGGMTK